MVYYIQSFMGIFIIVVVVVVVSQSSVFVSVMHAADACSW